MWQRYIPDVTDAAKNRSMILEFRVADADREYRRLQGLVRTGSSHQPPSHGATIDLFSRSGRESGGLFHAAASAMSGEHQGG